ncbi:uncharacterized protein JCM10292_001256 [Rhodotorula paludigena]|uniref:uncharacterized protein n=1 Tax=Rhodotorula paludigena TaxID=86838 RepID=UPI00316E441F
MDRQLALLQRHYAALSPSSPALLPSPPFPAPSTLSLPATQQFLVDRLLGHDQTLGDERGAHDWKRLFWRRVTKGIEQGFSERSAQGDVEVDDEEVHPDILEAMVDLLSSGSSAGAPGTSTRVYCWGDLAAEPDQWQSIRTREEGRLISGGTTGLRTWQACIALSNHLIASPAPVFRARRILELGAGVGLLTLVAARLAQQGQNGDDVRRRFVATDVDEKVLETLQGNVRTNNLENLAKCVKLDWELASDSVANAVELQQWRDEAFEGGGEPDLILGADIVYDPSLTAHLASTLAWLLQPRQGRETAPEALIAGTIRNESTWELFLHECRARQLQVNAVDLQVPGDQSGLVGAEGWEGEGEVRLVRIVAQ